MRPHTDLLANGRPAVLIDVCFNEEEGRAGVGFVILDQNRNTLAPGGRRIPCPGNVLKAEGRAAMEGIKAARFLGLDRLDILSDSSDLVLAIKRHRQLWNPGGLVINEIHSDLVNILEWDITHVPRSCNKATHEAAKRASHSPVPQAWFGIDFFGWVSSGVLEL
ncbi:hypothetical protein ACS0TY_033185 [Phlomoides rotata]